jgi:cation diffusion facilitator family transporter
VTTAAAEAQATVAEKVRAARLSVVSNTLITLLKLAVGVWTGSVAILSEAVHSATDLVAALIAFFAVRVSDQPPDDEHPYGHGKYESLSGAIEALLILGAGAYIVIEAARALAHPEPPRDLGWGIALMAGTAVVNLFVARHLMRVARKTDSLALLADAHHLQIDVWTSLGVVVGLLVVQFTGIVQFDALIALVVAAFVLRTAWRLTRDALHPLIDTVLPQAEVEQLTEVLKNDSRVLGYHKLRTRKSGSQRHIDVHIQVTTR